MKKKELQQLSKKPVAELQKKVQESRNKLWQLRVDLAAGKVKNIKQIRSLRQDISQMLTFINNHGE
ncbi:TPA: 50S ribosomal protein L29 [Patescibacteria group bacterium]|jgi:ribosomal protein L29|nr:50S ribosomal protein L29 [Patescibacteria group bacterium]|tara:strand:- start:9817 stop:10014 length:198 start_codon:yes stop_codon:yes gene_type:complete